MNFKKQGAVTNGMKAELSPVISSLIHSTDMDIWFPDSLSILYPVASSCWCEMVHMSEESNGNAPAEWMDR